MLWYKVAFLVAYSFQLVSCKDTRQTQYTSLLKTLLRNLQCPSPCLPQQQQQHSTTSSIEPYPYLQPQITPTFIDVSCKPVTNTGSPYHEFRFTMPIYNGKVVPTKIIMELPIKIFKQNTEDYVKDDVKQKTPETCIDELYKNKRVRQQKNKNDKDESEKSNETNFKSPTSASTEKPKTPKTDKDKSGQPNEMPVEIPTPTPKTEATPSDGAKPLAKQAKNDDACPEKPKTPETDKETSEKPNETLLAKPAKNDNGSTGKEETPEAETEEKQDETPVDSETTNTVTINNIIVSVDANDVAIVNERENNENTAIAATAELTETSVTAADQTEPAANGAKTDVD